MTSVSQLLCLTEPNRKSSVLVDTMCTAYSYHRYCSDHNAAVKEYLVQQIHSKFQDQYSPGRLKSKCCKYNKCQYNYNVQIVYV